MQVSVTRFVVAVVGIMLLTVSAGAEDYRYSVGGGGSVVLMTGGDFFSFDRENSYSFYLGHHLSDRWRFDLDYTVFELSNNIDRDSTSSIGSLSNNSPLRCDAMRLGLMFERLLFSPERWLNMTFGLGGGLLVWKGIDPGSNTTYEVKGEKNQTTDFAASELILSSSAAIVLRLLSSWTVDIYGRVDYLTGAGAEFESAVSSARDRWLLGMGSAVHFHFGRRPPAPKWRLDENGKEQPPAALAWRRSRDSDNDGVSDDLDRCLNTPHGAIVDRFGCPLDTDGDGVADGLDDCPATDAEAREMVDINGCPVDSDFDGYPDYRDACPNNPVGALVDPSGCPVDSDGDGVPDGLDDCPYTLVGVAVDRNGCIDLSMFSKPMMLNIDYVPGSFEVDPNNLERLKKLAGLLNFVKDIKLEINGYTDNIGTTVANRKLSEKRASRVRHYLEIYGIAQERMRVFGRGETNFVASNQTAQGRAKNRRIEITFYK